ncbi:DUF262 domain-containing protein [Actinopolyspora sp. H202]|uniref:DUF262 domain-containing protein n=1 Tax=Actinopolyspora sp. H202 TaxID=1500456 RepID=UPI003EE7ED11
MRSDTLTIKQLFELNVRYQIPLYQRPYVWKKADQWEPLWNDVSALLRHQESGSEVETWSHFLGAIVVEQEATNPGRIPRYTVIDGQQRLTTLQLLLSAAAKAASAVGAAKEAKLLRRLVENDPDEVEADELLKVWPTNADRATFAEVMAPEAPNLGHGDNESDLIREAFGYFTARVTEYLAGEGEEAEDATDESVSTRANRLLITLRELLKVVSITLEKDDNAQVIFETLNARGTPLLSLDLVKNAVFRLATSQGKDADKLYEKLWRPQLDDDYWRQSRRQGRLFRPVGELFLMHWLTMRLERIIPATELFAAFRQGILNQAVDAEELVTELCSDAAVMRSFDEVDPATPEGEFFARFRPLDASIVMPIVLWLFRSPEVSTTRRRQALRILESWLARRALMRLTTKNYNRFVPRLLTVMKADPEHADQALYAALVGREGAVSRWPDDEEFIESLSNRYVYGNVSQQRLVMALTAVETSLRGAKSEQTPVTAELSLEHLLPQDWEKHWPLDGATNGQDDPAALERAKQERAASLHKLGNLTVVAQPLNSAMSNAAWETKRTALNEHSVLLLNNRLAARDSWDEQAINEHGQWLARRMAEIWPGPGQANWPDPGN